jgi:ABC-type amino acid transport substrate-binding protein
MKTLLTSALLALLLAGPALGADLQGTLKKIKDAKTITLGYRDSSPPFSFAGVPGKPTGYSVDLCVRIAAAIQRDLGLNDLQVRWVPVTVDSRMAAVANGTIDIECGSTTNTLSRQEQVDFSYQTFVDGGSLLATAASGIKTVSDLGGKRVALIPGTTTEKALKEAITKAYVNPQFVIVKDHAEGVATLENKTADAYASDMVLLIGLAIAIKDRVELRLAEEYFSYEPYALMMRRNDSAFRLAVNRTLVNLYRSGEILPIFAKWFGGLGAPGPLLKAMYLLNSLPD